MLVRIGKSAAYAELATFCCAVLMLGVRLEDRWANLLRFRHTKLNSVVINVSECRVLMRSELAAIETI